MQKRLALLASALVVGLAAAGCGGGDGSGDKGGGSLDSSGGKSGQVSMKGLSFEPADLKVKVGETVKWVNDDDAGHDVTGTGGPGGKFKSGAPGGLQKGDTFEHKFTKPGTVQYVCTVHSNMKGKIEIE